MKRLLLLRGYPGSGKTTVGTALAMAGQGRFIDHNKLLNLIDSMAGGDAEIYDEIHQLELAMARQVLSGNESVIVARGFTSVDSIIPYQQLAAAQEVLLLVVRLEVPVEVLIDRVEVADRHKNAQSINNAGELQRWMTNHIMESFRGEKLIDATKSIEVLTQEIVTQQQI